MSFCYDRPFTNHHTNLANFDFLFSIPSRSKQHRTPQYVNNPPRPISRPWRQSYKMMATIWSTTQQIRRENRSESTSRFYRKVPTLTLTRFIICRFPKLWNENRSSWKQFTWRAISPNTLSESRLTSMAMME